MLFIWQENRTECVPNLQHFPINGIESDVSPGFQQGRYIPVFASEVYDQNAYLVEVGLTPINLTSVMIGLCHFPLEVIPNDRLN